MLKRKRILCVALSLLLSVLMVPLASLPVLAEAGFITVDQGSGSGLPVEAGTGCTLIQSVYSAEQLGGEEFPIRAVVLNLSGLPDTGIGGEVEVYLANVPAGTAFGSSTAWQNIDFMPQYYEAVMLQNGEIILPLNQAFSYDGTGDLLMSVTLTPYVGIEDTAYFAAASVGQGVSLVANAEEYVDVWDAEQLSATFGTRYNRALAVTFLDTYDFSVMIVPTKGGSVSAVPETASLGDTVELTAVPYDGYDFMGYRVYTAGGVRVETEGNTFVMPGDDVFVTGYFRNILDGSEFFHYADTAPEAAVYAGEMPFLWGIRIPAEDISMMGYEKLASVGFWYLEECPGDYEIRVTVGETDVLDKTVTVSGASGWYTVDLDKPVELAEGDDVGIYLYTENLSAPGAYSADRGNPNAGLIWYEDYAEFIDARYLDMPLTWMIGAGFEWEIPTYTVTLKANDGTNASMTADRATIQTAYPQPACPFSRPYKTFKGWSLTPNGQVITFPTVLSEDTALYAIWEDSYSKVSFDANGGSGSMTSKVVVTGDVYTLPANGFTAPANKKFAGWAYADGTPATNFTVTGDVTLKAMWEDIIYTVSFDANGGKGTMEDVPAVSGTTYTLPACGFTAPANKKFAGWAYADGTPATDFTVTGDVTLKAMWEDIIYTVTFDANGGKGTMEDVPAVSGTTYTLPANGFTAPANKKFAGWAYADGTPATSFTVTGDVTLKAVWEDIIYTVSFDANGGKGTMEDVPAVSGSTFVLPANGFTAPANKKFAGWAYADGTPATNFTVTGDVTLKAVWEDIIYTVTFDANGGKGTMEGVPAVSGTTYTLPANGFTAPANKKFAGWAYADGTKANNFTVTGDVTLKAVWEDIVYTVTFDANGGEGTMEGVPAVSGSAFTLPACGFTAPANKKFAGWAYADGTPATDFTVTSDVTLMPIWADEVYTISFVANGGEGTMEDVPAISGSTFVLPANGFTAPANKKFAGWAYADGTTATNFTVTGDVTLKAVWEDIVYTVTFDANGGEGTMEDVPAISGSTFVLPANGFTAPANKKFAGWAYADGTKANDFTVTGDVTLKAMWEDIIYTVTFDANGGEGTMEGVPAVSGTTYTLPACGFTAPANKKFAGWAYADGTPAQNFTVTSDVTLMPIWADEVYTISFVANGGEGTMEAVPAISGSTFVLPANGFTAPANKKFAGWAYADGTKANNFTVTGDVTLKAVWEDIIYTVTFDANGGEGTMEDVPAISGSTFTLPANGFTAPANKKFAGWAYADGTPATNFTVTGDVTLKAVWEDIIYTVSFDANGGEGTMEDVPAISGSTFVLPANGFTAPANKKFAGWAYADGTKANNFTVTGDVTLKAVWEDIVYTVSFDANGGEGTMEDVPAVSGSTFTLPANGFTAPANKKFAGWAYADGTTATNFTVTGDVTLKAVWEDIVYTVTFDANGGKGTMEDVPAISGSTFVLPANGFTAPANKKFAGWAYADGTPATNFTVTSDVTLMPIWADEVYTISFVANGGEGTMEAVPAVSGTTYTLPACGFTAPANKKFAGWAYADGTPATNFTVTGDVTLKAVWEDIIYTVTFDANGGEGTMEAVPAVSGSTFVLPANGFTAPANKKFAGWAYADGTTATNFTVTGDVTLKAVWEDIIYTVTFDANGGEGTMEGVPAISGSTFTLPANGFTAPANKKFAGWAYADGTKANNFTVTGDVTLKAVWEDIIYTVSFDANGGKGTMEDVPAVSGTTYTLPANGFTAPANKKFAGWAYADGTTATNFTVTGDVTLKAVWEDIIYTVSFDANGGEGTMEDVPAVSGSAFTLPACGFTAPANKKFAGWAYADGTLATNFTVTGDVTLKAMWEDIIYTVSFDANGGEGTMEDVPAISGSTFVLPANGFTAPANKKFAGWAYADGTPAQNFTVTADVTLKAVWEDIIYTVTFDANGGEGKMEDVPAISGSAFTLPACGFTAPVNGSFAGWALTAGGEALTEAPVITDDVTLYAVWNINIPDPDTFTVYFDANGGSGEMTSVTVNAGTLFTVPDCGFEAPEGLFFAGWTFTDGSAADEFVVTADVTLCAAWETELDAAFRWAVESGMFDDEEKIAEMTSFSTGEFWYRLWLASGSPVAENRTMYFIDVPEDAYYYEAVLWALENKYINTPAHRCMKPDDTMTRQTVITVLYSLAGKPQDTDEDEDVHFTDTYYAAGYINALDWAVDTEIVTENIGGRFKPHADVQMADAVLWLFRMLG